MTPETMEKLFDTFLSTLKNCYIWIEDVYITGVLAEIADISIASLNKWVHLSVPNKTKSYISAHANDFSPQERLALWQKHFG